MREIAVLDGVEGPLVDARLPLTDRAVLYGDGLFETVRVYDGRPFRLEAHLGRLLRAAGRLSFRLPWGAEVLRREVAAALDASGAGDATLRLLVTGGDGPPGERGRGPRRVVTVTALRAPPAERVAAGVGVITVPCPVLAPGVLLGGVKGVSYLANLLALEAARRAGAEDSVFVDPSGAVAEGATSNLFLARGGALVTAPESAGILPGITRAEVLSIAEELGVPIELRVPTIEELRGADEAFLSSSLREILGVASVDGRAVGGGSPGPLTRRIHDRYRARVAAG